MFFLQVHALDDYTVKWVHLQAWEHLQQEIHVSVPHLNLSYLTEVSTRKGEPTYTRPVMKLMWKA